MSRRVREYFVMMEYIKGRKWSLPAPLLDVEYWGVTPCGNNELLLFLCLEFPHQIKN